MEKETWRDIEGYEGLYQVSNTGNIKSLRNGKGRLRKQFPNKDGYLLVSLCKEGKLKSYTVHRLVAKAFILNYNNLPEINHIDADKANNHINNLEWCSRLDNMHHELCFEKISKKVICLNTNQVFNSMKEVEDMLKIHHSDISKCCLGKRQSAGKHLVTGEKLRWRYIEEGLL